MEKKRNAEAAKSEVDLRSALPVLLPVSPRTIELITTDKKLREEPVIR